MAIIVADTLSEAFDKDGIYVLVVKKLIDGKPVGFATLVTVQDGLLFGMKLEEIENEAMMVSILDNEQTEVHYLDLERINNA